MVRIFKQNDITSSFALVFIAFLVKVRYIFHPPALSEITHFNKGMLFSFPSWESFYTKHPSIYMLFSITVLFIFSFLLNYVVNREKFLHRKSYLPAVAFLLFSSFTPSLNVFSTAFIANCFLFLAFANTMQLYNADKPRRACFNIGFLVAVAALFYFPSILFFFLFLALLLLLRPFVLEENIAFILGIIAPIYLALSIIFLSGRWHDMQKFVHFNITPPLKTMPMAPLLGVTIVSITMLVYGLFLTNQAGLKNAIAIRKKWNAVVIYLFFACIAGIFTVVFPGYTWILTIAPISIIISQTFMHKKDLYNLMAFYAILISILIIQWAL